MTLFFPLRRFGASCGPLGCLFCSCEIGCNCAMVRASRLRVDVAVRARVGKLWPLSLRLCRRGVDAKKLALGRSWVALVQLLFRNELITIIYIFNIIHSEILVCLWCPLTLPYLTLPSSSRCYTIATRRRR